MWSAAPRAILAGLSDCGGNFHLCSDLSCIAIAWHQQCAVFPLHIYNFLTYTEILKLIFREGEEGRERNIDWLLHLLMHSLVDSCMCPDWGLNP